MQKIKFVLKYLGYLLTAKTRYGVHPPFLFDLVTNVFRNKKAYADYSVVEEIRMQLLNDKHYIEVHDLGAGSTYFKNPKRRICDIAKTSSKYKKHVQLIYRIIHYLKPNNILELGTSLGITTSYMALANPAAKIVTLEGCPSISSIAQKNFNEINAGNIELIIGAFDDNLSDILEQKQIFDLIFIDGNHSKEPTIRYFEQILPKTDNNSIMIFDDIHWSEDMESAWGYIKNHPSVMLTIDIFFMGIVFLKKELTKEHFTIRY